MGLWNFLNHFRRRTMALPEAIVAAINEADVALAAAKAKEVEHVAAQEAVVAAQTHEDAVETEAVALRETSDEKAEALIESLREYFELD